jgi:hypothetical protein
MAHNAFVEDLRTWESSLKLTPQERTSSWIFIDSTTLDICTPERIYVVKANKPLMSVLAIFDIIYTFWEIGTHQNANNDPSVQRFFSYHRSLRSKILDALLQSKDPRKELDVILQPWIMRTLCLYSHDCESREAFDAVIRPTYLTEDCK